MINNTGREKYVLASLLLWMVIKTDVERMIVKLH